MIFAIQFPIKTLKMSKRIREKSESNSSQILALLDRTKERLLDRRQSEAIPAQVKIDTEANKSDDFDLSSVSSSSMNEISRNNLLDQIAEMKEMFRAQELAIDSMQNEFSYSPKSPRSPRSPKSSISSLIHHSPRSPRSPLSPRSPRSPMSPDSPKALRTRKMQTNPKHSNKLTKRSSKEAINSGESALGKVSGNKDEEQDYSIFASTLLGYGSSGVKRTENVQDGPVLRFLRKTKPFVFSKQVLLRSCISILNL